MNKKIILISTFLLLMTFLLIGCDPSFDNNSSSNVMTDDLDREKNDSNEMPGTMPNDFQIIYTFGLEQANQHDGINTQEGIIQKDLVLDGLAKSSIEIKNEKLMKIYDLLYKINIISYPKNYKPLYMENTTKDTFRYVTPSKVYNLWIKYDDIEYSLYWHDENASEMDEAKLLRESLEGIKEIIRSFEEYEELGERNGYYE